jgi:hypothetical protein
MFQCGMNFQSIPLHIIYSFQHFEYAQIQIEPSYTSYKCTIFLHNINESKLVLCQVLNKVFKNKIIPLVQKSTQLKNILFHHVLLLLKFISCMGMGNIRCMVVLLMSL